MTHAAQPAADTSALADIPIVLLHGLGRTAASMLPLDWRLGRAGFRTVRLAYPSTSQRIDASVAHIRSRLPAGPVAIVGHSLGGLIGARLLRESDGAKVVRVVQLGSPNLGSPLAGRLGPVWPVRQVCGPALKELVPHHNMPPADHRIAAVAGTGGWLIPGTGLERPHDGAVSRRSAWAGAGHRAELPVLHTLLPASPEAARLCIRFLRTGALSSIAAETARAA